MINGKLDGVSVVLSDRPAISMDEILLPNGDKKLDFSTARWNSPLLIEGDWKPSGNSAELEFGNCRMRLDGVCLNGKELSYSGTSSFEMKK